MAKVVSLPIIDLEGCKASPSIGRKLVESLGGVGFAYIINHGVKRKMVTDVLKAGKRFFEKSEDEKLKIRIPPISFFFFKI